MTLGPDERGHLLRVARNAIARAVGALDAEAPERVAPVLESEHPEAAPGAFVSLHRRRDGELRGCIGCFEGRGRLDETVARMAVEAALRDPRFEPVRANELAGLTLEISVLSPMMDVADPAAVEVGRHGVVVSRGGRRGVLLPQVATDHGLTREEFLEHTCLKAGLDSNAWRKPGTRIQTFTAEVFSEEDRDGG